MSHLCSVNVLCDESAVGGAVIILVGVVECVMLCGMRHLWSVDVLLERGELKYFCGAR